MVSVFVMWTVFGIASFLPILAVVTADENHLLETDCECGVRNHDTPTFLPRGVFSENHAWPWMVSIVNATDPDDPIAYCGATLINDRYILTAAHCIPDMLDTGVRNFRVYLGTNGIRNGTNFLDLGIRQILSHYGFDYETADNDDGSLYVGETGYITGWGSYNLTEPTEDFLKEAVASIVSNEECAKNYSSVEIPITENMLCASTSDEDDPCKGDSGGPIVIKEKIRGKEVYTQIGIISHGEGCAVADYPAIFSRVSSFIGWIKENTKDGVYCVGSFSS